MFLWVRREGGGEGCEVETYLSEIETVQDLLSGSRQKFSEQGLVVLVGEVIHAFDEFLLGERRL